VHDLIRDAARAMRDALKVTLVVSPAEISAADSVVLEADFSDTVRLAAVLADEWRDLAVCARTARHDSCVRAHGTHDMVADPDGADWHGRSVRVCGRCGYF
jgi:hypothetical protein